MALLTKNYLINKVQASANAANESQLRNFSNASLNESVKAASIRDQFDIFLSHSFEDAILIKGLRDELADQGYSVYVDWINDPLLDRTKVTKESAAALKARMMQSKCLLYATSDAAKKSVWMPWELGFMDSYRDSRVAIAPIVDDTDQEKEFRGQEYLSLYPYLDKTSSLWIHRSGSSYVSFSSWLAGGNPK